MINVKKNFLSKEIHKDLFSVIQSDEFAWFHTKTLQKQKTNDIQFCHSLYHSNNVASNYFNTLNMNNKLTPTPEIEASRGSI